jgi:hypothetical protein
VVSLGVFEASLVLSNSLVWTFRHPHMYLPQHWHVYTAHDNQHTRSE